ncbi:MAG: class II fructose-bisphosphatase [Firmicutes bacterium]|nr:class II fructose-bisphosphatase [Bacillota bacterium]
MSDLQRGIAMEFVRVTEAAALRASRWLGNGNKEQVDQAASDAMRGMLDLISIKGTVIIGEGEKDRAPMLHIGEKVGNWNEDGPGVDIAVDPVDGTRLVANGLPNALSVVAAGEHGSLLPVPSFYMHKLACGPALKGKLDINAGVRENLKVAAAVLNKDVKDLTILILDRERHLSLIEEVRRAGARIKLISDGDVAGAIATAINSIDIYMGIGGAPEGVLAAAALRCLDGEIQTKFYATDDSEKEKIAAAGYQLDKVYYTEDLAKGEEIIFSATGITGGEFLEGVSFRGNQTAVTHSIVMRAKYRTVRYIKAIHNLKYKTIPSRARNTEEKV